MAAVEAAPQHHASTSASHTAMSDGRENGSAIMGTELKPSISNSSEFDASTDIVAILGKGDPTSSQPPSGAATPASEISQDDAEGTRKRSGTVVPVPTVLARSSTPPNNASDQSLLKPSAATPGRSTTRKYDDHSPIPDTPVNGTVSPADTLEATIAKLQARCADLAGQVTSLNGKLVQSYNRVGGLEDDVHTKTTQSTTLQKQVQQLEAQRKEWEDKFEGGLLVEKDHVKAELSRMMDQVIKETASRGKAEKDKATIERELAELSSQLFQEANQMVAAEHVAKVRAERRMQELEQNLKDTEAMMMGQSEQMRGLGGKLEEIEAERDDLKKQLEEVNEAASNSSAISIGSVQTISSSNPFSPESSFSAMPGTPGGSNRSLQQALMAKHPLQYLALDVQPYFEFVVFTKGMIRIRKNIMERRFLHNESHYASGVSSYASAYGTTAGVGHGAHTMTSPKPSAYQTAMLKQEQNEALAEALPMSQYTTFPFIKRLQDEDTVATLHLEDAPGLSFFSRGKISNAILDGNLAIEPAYISLPSDQCCMCGASLQRFIASHQTTKKEDPRKTLTRLATGWIPGSGTNTPTKNESSGFSIATLTNALEALTPSRELAGFNFGIPSGEGRPPVRRTSGGPNSTLSGPRGSDRERALAASAASRPATAEGQGNFPLIAAARQNAQVYLFRTTDSESKYAICPTYCLPRLRAVCDLWTYVRTIQRGLLTEDTPKFVAPPATSEYAQQTRRLSNQMPPPSATTAKGGWQGFASAIATPQINASRQLMLPADAARGNGAHSLSSSVNSGKPPVIAEEPSSTEAVTGLGLDIQTKDFALQSPNPSTESLASSISTAPTSAADSASTASTASTAPTEASTSVENLPETATASEAGKDESKAASAEVIRRPSIEINTPGGEHVIAPGSEVPPAEGQFKLAWPPARPKRSAARDGASTPSTPVPEQKDGASFTHAVSPKVSQLASAIANAQNQPVQSASKAAVAASAPTSAVAPPPTPVTGPVSANAAAPPKLPPRATVPPLHSPNALRLPARPALSKLSTSTTSAPQSILANTSAGAAVSVAQQNWQEKAWFEIVRLKETAFWTRVGSQHQQH